jgi:hypothetical protein
VQGLRHYARIGSACSGLPVGRHRCEAAPDTWRERPRFFLTRTTRRVAQNTARTRLVPRGAILTDLETSEALGASTIETLGKPPCSVLCPACGRVFSTLRYLAAFEASRQPALLASCRCGASFWLPTLDSESTLGDAAGADGCPKCGSSEVLARGWRADLERSHNPAAHSSRFCCLCRYAWTIEDASPDRACDNHFSAIEVCDAADAPAATVDASNELIAPRQKPSWMKRLQRVLFASNVVASNG